MNEISCWIHFGDLHISAREDQNYSDFLSLIEEANRHMRGGVDFALLPGDNADDGEEHQYQLVKAGLRRLALPVHAIPGDHDMAGGSLDLFRHFLNPEVNRSFKLGKYRFLLFNSVEEWQPPLFGLGHKQMGWLRRELASKPPGERVIAFLHAYPSEHGSDANELTALLGDNNALLIEMGHTHYNELANDGRMIYAATRSTGQIEEGPAGFSVTAVDGGVVSWKFKPLTEWPLVMITSPADERLITDPSSTVQVVRGQVEIRVRAWADSIRKVIITIDDEKTQQMAALDECTWSKCWNTANLPNGMHVLTATAQMVDGRIGIDRIRVCVNAQGQYRCLLRHATDYENALGKWADKHILGTQLGPNENGHAWPSRKERRRPVGD